MKPLLASMPALWFLATLSSTALASPPPPQLVKDIFAGNTAAGSTPSYIRAVGSTVFFTADDGIHGNELWKSDGTADGTALVQDILPGIGGSFPSPVVVMGDSVYFTASTYNASGGVITNLWKNHLTSGVTEMVKDIYAGTSSGDMLYPVEMNGWLYFTANDGTHGHELWKSDGTLANTALVKDIRLGASASSMGPPVKLNGLLYFVANDGTHGQEIWESNGLEGGTKIVKDINSNSNGSGILSQYTQLVPMGDHLFFSANDGSNGYQLWKTDGSDGGTVMVKNGSGGALSPQNLIAAGSRLYFTANTAANGNELWTSDGSAIGTYLVKDICPGFGSYTYSEFSVIGNTLLFRANDGVNGYELWKSDGTTEGTMMVKDIFPVSGNSDPAGLCEAGGVVYFRASDGVHGTELWRTDGTSAHTVMVKDILSVGASSSPSQFTAALGNAFFVADDGVHGPQWWTSDGTATGTLMVKDFLIGSGCSGVGNLMAVGNRLYFTATDGTNSGLWSSDGTAAGTMMLKVNTTSTPSNLTAVGASLYFTLSYQTSDTMPWYIYPIVTTTTELWKSDGTVQGTVLVTSDQIMSDPYSYSAGPYMADFSNLTPVGNTLFFTEFKSNGSSSFNPSNGSTLWRLDATTGVAEIILTSWGNSNPYQQFPTIGSLTAMSSTLYFQAPGTPDYYSGTQIYALWKSDGTNVGTTLVKENIISFLGGSTMVTLGNELYFTGDNNALWQSDGTETGTLPMSGPFNNVPSGVTRVGGKQYFSGSDATHGAELWVSDGTDVGTFMVKDIHSGSAGSNPQSLTPVSGALYFLADDGIHGSEIWKSDGTAAGTLRLADITGGPAFTSYGGMLAVGTQLFFTAATPAYGSELYVYDSSQGAPNIAVEQPAGTSLSTGTISDFGSVLVGTNSPLTFTIKNTGTADLVLGTITKDGANAADFSVSAPASTPLARGASTTFSVQFAPSASGTRSATLHIASNVTGTKNPFDINLTGIGATALAGFNEFVSTHSSLADLAADASATPFNDGVSNLLKYAFNLNLAGPDNHTLSAATANSGLPLIALSGSGAATQIHMEFLRRKNSGLIYTPKYATDLTTFTPTTGTSTVTSIDAEWERVIVQQPANPATTSQCFGRVEVTLP
ncbi:MAG: ELWxxDGT repeat protein [Verrucomicrobiota bacterium]